MPFTGTGHKDTGGTRRRRAGGAAGRILPAAPRRPLPFLLVLLLVLGLVAGSLLAFACAGEEATGTATVARTATATAADRPSDVVVSASGSPTPGETRTDVTYSTSEAGELKMDVYFPRTPGPWPVVVSIHGGGWSSGDKSDAAGAALTGKLVDAGFVVAAVNYRLAPEWRFPAQIEDVKCAVRHLRANSSAYGIDPRRIGAYGGSAGGHLAALLGAVDDDDFDGGSGASSRVRAVVEMFGPTDLTVPFPGGAVDTELGEQVFGSNDASSPLLKEASPVNYVGADDPPFLIVHGMEDSLVPFSQSLEFYHAIQQSGGTARLVRVANAGHGLKPVGGTPQPSREEVEATVVGFFRGQLQ